MNIQIPLLDAALNGDPLAKCQISDILEDYKFKRWPEFKFRWETGINDRSYLEHFDCYISLSTFTNKYQVVDNGLYIGLQFDTEELAMKFVENNLTEKIKKLEIRE
jgi:hypothetical protein